MFNIYKRNYNINCLVNGNTKENIYESYISTLDAYRFTTFDDSTFGMFDKDLNTIIEYNGTSNILFIYEDSLSSDIKEKCEKFKESIKKVFPYLHIKKIRLYHNLSSKGVYHKYIKPENKINV